MIKDEAQAVFEDGLGINPVILDVNFDNDHPDYIRITIGGVSSIVKYTDLFSFMFTIATKEQQAKMIPVREELGHQYMKQIQVRLKKDMKEGDMVVVNVPINIPQIIEDAIIPSPYLTEDKDK